MQGPALSDRGRGGKDTKGTRPSPNDEARNPSQARMQAKSELGDSDFNRHSCFALRDCPSLHGDWLERLSVSPCLRGHLFRTQGASTRLTGHAAGLDLQR